MIKFNLLLVIIFGAVTASCDNPAAVTPGTISKNIVTGMFITTEYGPDAIAVWGNPNFPGANEGRIELGNPYPNPSDGLFRVGFMLPIHAVVSMWIETAYWSGEEVLLPMQPRVEKSFQRFVLMENQRLSPGYHAVNFNFGTKCHGDLMNSGFYRVFLKVGDLLSWKDIFIAGAKNEIPPSLRKISQHIVARNCN